MSRSTIYFFLVCLLTSACAKKAVTPIPNVPPRTVAIDAFKCDCQGSMSSAVQEALLDGLFKATNAKLLKGTQGDLRVVGTIVTDEGESSASRGKGFAVPLAGGASGSSKTSAGGYISGLTMQVYEGDVLIATHSVGQDLGKGVLLSPVSMAAQGAKFIAATLIRQRAIGRREP